MSPTDRTAGPQLVVDVRDAFCLHALPEGAVVALRGITLAVARGERVVVHGPNGSGKTTLLRLLAGEQALAAGRAVVAGRAVGEGVGGRAGRTAAAARWRAEQLGWVDQQPGRTLRPELDVVDNVALQQRLAGVPIATARATALEALATLGAGHLAHRGVVTLSGGEAQRVAVAAALAHGPALVLADEPSGELDAVNAELVYDTLAAAAAAAGAALVLVSHDRRAARIADRVVRIRDGRLSETWRPGGEELLVVDDRGWLRLPEQVRPAADAVRALPDGDAVTLEPVGPAPVGAAPAPAVLPGPAAGGAAGPVASLKGVTKAYGERVVLAGLDLDVPGAALTVVRGRSGAGKSTLLRVLVGLEPPDAGRVELAGVDLTGLDRAALARVRREHAAVVGQSVHLAETSDALTNLEVARAFRGLPPDPEGDLARLEALDLSALRHRAVRLLSGGERQRAAVARALAVGASLVVLDEPSSQLDEASVERLAAVLVAAARAGTGVVVASHDPVLVDAADQVVDLEPAP